MSAHFHTCPTVLRNTIILTDRKWSFWGGFFLFNLYDGLFPLSSSGFGPLFLDLLYKRE